MKLPSARVQLDFVNLAFNPLDTMGISFMCPVAG